MATSSKSGGLNNEKKFKPVPLFIDSDTSFDLSNNESIEDYQPQASELLTNMILVHIMLMKS